MVNDIGDRRIVIMPFAGYQSFSQCVKAQSKRLGIDSPAGLCHVIEQNALGRPRRNPRADLIQTSHVGPWHFIDYIDEEDEVLVRRQYFAPGVRLLTKGKSFTIVYALFKRHEGRWTIRALGDSISGHFDLARQQIAYPTRLSRQKKYLVDAADVLLTWVARQKA